MINNEKDKMIETLYLKETHPECDGDYDCRDCKLFSSCPFSLAIQYLENLLGEKMG